MKIIKLFYIILFSLLNICTYSQTVQWAITHGYNKTASVTTKKIVADALGNSYSIGEFSSDTTIFGTSTLVPVGGSYPDIYIAKTTSNGTERWAKSVGGLSWENAYSMSIDESANIYVAGTFSFSAVFGTYTLSSASYYPSFICKLDSAGTILWARKYGDPGDSYINNLYNDAAGNLYATGRFSGTCIFGTYTLTSAGSDDAFVAKLDNNGNVVWCQKMGGTTSDYATGLAIDDVGDIYVSGHFSGNAAIGPYLLTNTGPGSWDIFVAKLSTAGTVLWAKKFGESTYALSSAISSSGGKIYFGGMFTPPATFGTFTLTTGTSYICQIDAAGNTIWANKFEGVPIGSGNAYINSIATDGVGNVYSTGYFNGTCAFGTNSLVASVLTENSSFPGQGDVFVSKLDASGNFVWVKQLYGPYSEIANSLVYTAGKIFVTGNIQSSATIDTYTVSNLNGNAFVLKINDNAVGIKENTQEIRISIYPNPVSDKLHVCVREEVIGGIEINLWNVIGDKLVSRKYATFKNETLDISNYANGIYLLQINSSSQTITRKIIKN